MKLRPRCKCWRACRVSLTCRQKERVQVASVLEQESEKDVDRRLLKRIVLSTPHPSLSSAATHVLRRK
eukprot:763381-Hanusia_phi.AAC.4